MDNLGLASAGTPRVPGMTETYEDPDDADEASGYEITEDMHPVTKLALRTLQREQEERERLEAACQLTPRRKRRVTGGSIVFSVRLDPEEYAALERRAIATEIKPTVLARAYIRTGIARRCGLDVVEAVDRLEAAVEELRAVVGR